jgi:hypothetical protein
LQAVKSGAAMAAPPIGNCVYAMAKIIDATVPMIIMIATTKLKILSPLLIGSLPYQELPIDA